MSDLQAAALGYVQRGWALVPLHSIVNGRCTCGKPACATPGKHPIGNLVPHGVKDATCDGSVVRGWWTRASGANIGMATGEPSGVDVLDIDPRSGGDEVLRDLTGEHGPLPDGPMALTGGGGEHRYFRHVEGARNITIAPGLEYRSTGCLVVLPPSAHASGRRYDWEVSSGPDMPLPEPPGWLLERCVRSNGHRLDVAGLLDDLCEGSRNTDFSRIIGKLHHDRWAPGDIIALLSPLAEKVGFDAEELAKETEGICGRYPQPASSSWEGIRV